jgi:hypothetical protein
VIRTGLRSAFCLCIAPLLVAQQTIPATPSSSLAKLPEAQQTLTLNKGTEIEFLTVEDISSATAVNGQRITLEVGEDVWQNGSLVVRRGAPGIGNVRDVKRAVAGKRNGYVEVEPLSFTLEDGTRVKLREYAPGEDSCGDMGPCWVLSIFVVLFSPLLVARLASDHKTPKHPPVKGEEDNLQAHSPCWGFTASRTTFRSALSPRPEEQPVSKSEN